MIIVISGPSGVGKGSILSRLLEEDKSIGYSVSVTTRAKRPFEVEGKSYYFLSEEEFDRMLANNEILEWDVYCGHKYGTPLFALENHLKEGKDIALDITLPGAQAIKKHFKEEAVTVFLLPPSFQDLEFRIRNRESETEEQIRARLKAARHELMQFGMCDYVIVNDKIENAVCDLRKIIHAERRRSFRNKGILQKYDLV
ncbi:MAG: guanylate kinase [Clostridiaceae bacterium]|nr:guanylate kinase [Clostridiaceae bacterium]